MEHYYVPGVTEMEEHAFVWNEKNCKEIHFLYCPKLAERQCLLVWMTSTGFGEFHEKR